MAELVALLISTLGPTVASAAIDAMRNHPATSAEHRAELDAAFNRADLADARVKEAEWKAFGVGHET